MRDRFSKQTKRIDLAIEQMVAVVDRTANEVMTNYLDSLHKRFHNHYFRYVCGMGCRYIEVYRHDGKLLAKIDDYVQWFGKGHINFRSETPLDEIKLFIHEFINAVSQNIYFDAEETPKPDFVAIKLEKMHGENYQ